MVPVELTKPHFTAVSKLVHHFSILGFCLSSPIMRIMFEPFVTPCRGTSWLIILILFPQPVEVS